MNNTPLVNEKLQQLEKERDDLQGKVAELEKEIDAFKEKRREYNTIVAKWNELCLGRDEDKKRITKQATQLSDLRRAAGDPVCMHEELCRKLISDQTTIRHLAEKLTNANTTLQQIISLAREQLP